jgi:hypothetical protein
MNRVANESLGKVKIKRGKKYLKTWDKKVKVIFENKPKSNKNNFT